MKAICRPSASLRFSAAVSAGVRWTLAGDLFARGIDPETERAPSRAAARRPCGRRATKSVRLRGRVTRPSSLPLANDDRPAEGLYTALEHEAMHQETLLYMWHRLPYDQKRRPDRTARSRPRRVARPDRRPGRRPHRGAGGGGNARRATAGSRSFGWDNEFDAHRVTCPLSTSMRPSHQRATSWRSSRLAATLAATLGRGGLGLAAAGPRHASGVLGQDRRRVARGAACSRNCRCPRHGRSTSATRKRPPTRAGKADA